MFSYRLLAVSLVSCAFLPTPPVAMAAHHFAYGSPEPDLPYSIGDVFVFESDTDGFTTLLLTVNPSFPPGGTDESVVPADLAFGSGGLYNIHIASDKQLEEGITLTVSFDGADARIGEISHPNAPLGEAGRLLGHAEVGKTAVLENGVKFWAGRSVEPYFVNAFDFSNFQAGINAGALDDKAFRKTNKDVFSQANISSIVMDVPNRLLDQTIHVFATTAKRDTSHGNEWIQVNRMGNALTSYIFFYNTPTLQFQHDQTRPDTDGDREMAISTNVFRAVVAGGAQKNPSAYSDDLAAKMTPDVLTYRLGDDSGFSFGGSGGRPLDDDISDTVFSAFVGRPFTDFVEDPGRYRDTFPYVIQVSMK
ncbi:MAG: DUF4331 domain-containing protein [Holophagales bacterium]|nr:DUF4331 domain-containing protein [Holophagales bacterium]